MPAPDLLRIAEQHQAGRRRLAASTATAAAKVWGRLDVADILHSWARQAALLRPAVEAAQGEAAGQADGYVAEALAAQGVKGRRSGRVAPAAFTGVASDGRDLLGLLMSPAYTTLRVIGSGRPVPMAVAAGGSALDAIVQTQIADAGRAADQVATAARPRIGFVRMVAAPCCARCAILAGRWYRYDAGFDRHPHCHCTGIPVAEDRAEDIRTDPLALFSAGQVRRLSAADSEAIRLGADPSQVVNAQRGMYVAGYNGQAVKATREGTVRGAAAGHQVRLMPEQILRDAGSREEAVRLLRRFGYIT